MSGQLELFPELPLGLRPPRRLRELGFSLDRLAELRDENASYRQRITQTEIELATIVAEARARGDIVSPAAYACVIGIEENREAVADNERRIDNEYSYIDRQLGRAIEKHLRRQPHDPA